MTVPRIAITLGDVAGVGPEVAVCAVSSQRTREHARPLLVGHPDAFRRAAQTVGINILVRDIAKPTDVDETPDDDSICCWNPGLDSSVLDVACGQVDPRAGQAAHDSLCAAAQLALDGIVDGVATPPLNKAALHAAGLDFPGHTEILADACGVDSYAMMLYLPPSALTGMRSALESSASTGLCVAHTTLHTSIASVPSLLTSSKVEDTIRLVHDFLIRIGITMPRVGVCALNPHGGENGLFGNEEAQIIQPAVDAAQQTGIDARGPFPTDTLVRRAVLGAFDGLVAMYHDQGHIPFKLIGFDRAVNITLGLPIIRTSPSHGTAFDIAWQGNADSTGMEEAILMASQLCTAKHTESTSR